jgi:preprotein translocase subunit SecB
MTKNFKILTQFAKDISGETPDVQTFIFVKENISKYQLGIDINSKALKNKMIEVNTILKFEDKELNEKKSFFEIVYATIVKIDEDVTTKQDIEKIVLCDVQNEIYPDLEKIFLSLLHSSGFPEVSLDKKIDFKKLYDERSN